MESREFIREQKAIVENLEAPAIERFVALESLTRKICEGPITLETLMPLIDAVVAVNQLRRIDQLQSAGPAMVLEEMWEVRTLKKQLQLPTAQDRKFAFSRIRKSTYWNDIIKPVLKERFPDVAVYNQEIKSIITALKEASYKEEREKKDEVDKKL